MSFWKDKLQPLLYPNRCPFCGTVLPHDEDFCASCAARLPEVTYQRYAAGGFPCCAPLLYQGAYAAAIKRYKYGGKGGYTHALALLTVRAVVRSYDVGAIDCITCVPMHPKDRRRFRHAEQLARECAALTGLPYRDLLEKKRQTPPQHSLKRADRAKNVRGAYGVLQQEWVRNRRVLLIDDIITTGNTLGECARMLQKSGCRTVLCAAVCTTII